MNKVGNSPTRLRPVIPAPNVPHSRLTELHIPHAFRFYMVYIVVIILAATAGYYSWKHHRVITVTRAVHYQQVVSDLRSATITNALPAFPTTTLLFENNQNESTTPNTLTLTDSNGNILKKIVSSDSQATYTSVDSPQIGNLTNNEAAILSNYIVSEDNITYSNRWSVISASGAVTYVPSTLETLLNGVIPSDAIPYIYGKNELVLDTPGAANPESTATTIMSDNLVTGQQIPLLHIYSMHNYGTYFYPESLNPMGTQMSFLARDVYVNNQKINGAAILVLNMSNNQFVVHNLPTQFNSLFPAASGFNQTNNPGVPNMWVSSDGQLMAYEGKNNHMSLFDVADNQSISIASGQSTVASGTLPQFSPDDNYLIVMHPGSLKGSNTTTLLSIYSTTNGQLIKQFSANTNNGSLSPDGWIGYNDLVVTTPSGSESYLISNDNLHLYPSALGTLDAVLSQN